MGSWGTHRIATGATVTPTAGGDVKRWALGNGGSGPDCGEGLGGMVVNIHLAFALVPSGDPVLTLQARAR